MDRFRAEGGGSVIEMDDLNTFAVVLAENADGSGARIEIQRSITFDESDAKSGMDTYCICTSSGASHYGGVISWTLDDTHLVLALEDAAADALGVEGGFVVELDVTEQMRAELNRGLHRALQSTR